MNVDYADDIVLLENSPIQAKSLLKAGPLKLMDKFTYIRSSVSSTENDINMQLAKAWTAINRPCGSQT